MKFEAINILMAMTRRNWVSYAQAKEYVRTLNLSNYKKFLEYVAENGLPEGIPRNPQSTYGSEYVSDSDFLGTEKRQFLPYEEAKKAVHPLKIGSRTKYINWHKENDPQNLPRHPNRVYIDEWEGWGYFLGKAIVKEGNHKVFRPYEEAVKYVHKQKIRSRDHWLQWVREGNKPDDIPANPQDSYAKKGWNGWSEFLGTKAINRLDVAKNMVTDVLYIVYDPQYPSNVLSIGVIADGKSALLERQQARRFQIVKTYKHKRDMVNHVNMILGRNARQVGEGRYIVPNIHQLLFELDGILEAV